MPFANAKETDLAHSTWSAPLPTSTIHAQSPFPMRHVSVHCYTVDPPYATHPCAATWPSACAPNSDWVYQHMVFY